MRSTTSTPNDKKLNKNVTIDLNTKKNWNK